MGNKKSRLPGPLLGSSVVLLLAGCTGQTAHLKPEAALLAETEQLQEFDSISAARENAVAESDQLVLLEETLGPASLPAAAEFALKEAPIGVHQNISAALDSETALATKTDTTERLTEEIHTEATAEGIPALPDDLWTRIRAGYGLPDKNHPRVNADINWYAKHQAYLDRTFTRSSPYLHYIVEQVEARNMPLEIALLPVVESAFQPFAYSHGRASGIWQFIPGTGRLYGLKIDWWYDGRRDIYAATDAALTYLQRLHKTFDGDWLLALAAYNAGQGNVRKAIRKNKKQGKGITFWELSSKLPKETRGYVPKLLAISAIVAAPDAHGVTLTGIPNQPVLARVDITSQIDLAIAADMADMPLEKLYTLNPAFNRWATPPSGPHHLLLPLEKVDSFQQKLAELPSEKRVKWIRHKIKDGENLGYIAQRYNTTVGTIQRTNKIKGNMIRAGKHLLIPVASRSTRAYALSAGQRLKTKQNTPKGGEKSTHIVQNGDTLWDLSMAHKVPVRSLASWNGIAPTDTLKLGQKLVIWSKHNTKTTNVATPPNSSPSLSALIRKINYRVRNGDSLARISQKFNVSVAQLKKWNPRARGKYIQPGQRLVLYVDVTQVVETS